MIVEFRCQNHHQQPSGQAGVCNQLLKADSKHAGKQVKCPSCQQFNVVPSQSQAAPVAVAENLDQSDPIQNDDASTQLSFGKFSPFSRCPSCGSLLDEKKKCTKCKYKQREMRSDDKPLDEIKIKPAGFQLFIYKKLNNVSPTMLVILHYVLFALFLISFVALGMLVSVCLGAFLMLVAVVLVALHVFVAIDIDRVLKKPAQKLSFWQQPIWDLVLKTVRGTNWSTNYTNSLHVVDRRESPIQDRDLFMIPEIAECHALDLQGSPITDQGLIAIRSCPKLKYLVLKNTQVTDEGVFRLQQAVPEAWIWY